MILKTVTFGLVASACLGLQIAFIRVHLKPEDIDAVLTTGQLTSTPLQCGQRCVQQSECNGFDHSWVEQRSHHRCQLLKVKRPCRTTTNVIEKQLQLPLDTLNPRRRRIYQNSSSGLPSLVYNCVDLFQIVAFNHNVTKDTLVSGFEERRSYKKSVMYDAPLNQMKRVISKAIHCQQFFKYESMNSVLYYGAWTSVTGFEHVYFPSGNASTRVCYCSGSEPCCCQIRTCRADGYNGKNTITVDEGYLSDMRQLPVIGLAFGDTGDSDEYGHYSLGPFVCAA